MADDLSTEWYLSVRTTLDRLRDHGGGLPEWLNDDEAACRYAARALANDALDLGRQRSRMPQMSASSTSGAPSMEESAAFASRAVSPATVVSWNEGLREMVGALNGLLATGGGGCPGCTSVMTAQLALGVLELLRFSPGGDSTAQDGRGGKTEWSQLVYEVLERLFPQRVTRVDGRMDARSRQLHKRCGDCA